MAHRPDQLAKRIRVIGLLQDPETRTKTNVALAEEAGCHKNFVAMLRRQLFPPPDPLASLTPVERVFRKFELDIPLTEAEERLCSAHIICERARIGRHVPHGLSLVH